MKKKVVLVADWIAVYGGAERVIKYMNNVFNFEKSYMLTNLLKPNELKEIYGVENPKIKQTFIKFFGNKFRWFFFLFHFLIERIRIDKNADIIISSSHAIAKGIKKNNNQIHISYFQCRNCKYIWDETNLYLGKARFLLYPLIKTLRKKDIKQAKHPDLIISNSNYVRTWVLKTYGLESKVIYPPVDLSRFHLNIVKQDYFIVVGRLEPYKRFDLIIKTFNILEKKLIVIGNGSQLDFLKSIAKENIIFKGYLESKEIYKYLKSAKAFIHAGIEDFGIAPIEAQACGTPVIALGQGGVLETVNGVYPCEKINKNSNLTGVFFRDQNTRSIIEAINFFEDKIKCFSSSRIRINAERFNTETFENNIRDTVDEFIKKYNEKNTLS